MSVKLLDNDAFYGYRVRRSVDGKLYQEYFSLKREGKRMNAKERREVEKVALARDVALRQEQERSRQQRKIERCFNDDGTVRGISYVVKTEKSGTLTPIYQVGIVSSLERKVICTSYSLNAHGREGAWLKAVETYARHKEISKQSRLYKQLLNGKPRVPAREAGKLASGAGKLLSESVAA